MRPPPRPPLRSLGRGDGRGGALWGCVHLTPPRSQKDTCTINPGPNRKDCEACGGLSKGGTLNGHFCSAFGLFDMRFRTPFSDMTIIFQAPMRSQKCGLGFVQRGYHIVIYNTHARNWLDRLLSGRFPPCKGHRRRFLSNLLAGYGQRKKESSEGKPIFHVATLTLAARPGVEAPAGAAEHDAAICTECLGRTEMRVERL